MNKSETKIVTENSDGFMKEYEKLNSELAENTSLVISDAAADNTDNTGFEYQAGNADTYDYGKDHGELINVKTREKTKIKTHLTETGKKSLFAFIAGFIFSVIGMLASTLELPESLKTSQTLLAMSSHIVMILGVLLIIAGMMNLVKALTVGEGFVYGEEIKSSKKIEEKFKVKTPAELEGHTLEDK